jgi:hypothetical protein
VTTGWQDRNNRLKIPPTGRYTDVNKSQGRRDAAIALTKQERTFIATAAIAIAILVANTVTHLEIAVSALYNVVVLMAVRFCSMRGVMVVATGCVGLTELSYVLTPSTDADDGDEQIEHTNGHRKLLAA